MPRFDLGFAPSSYRSPRPGHDGTSLQTLFEAFPDDDACLEHVFKVRFGFNAKCPRCGQSGAWRRHRVHKHYFHGCGGILSPMAGVVFSRSRVPLQLWFYAMLHFANSAESVSSALLARQLEISGPTALRLAQRIRWHMAALDHGPRIGAPGSPVIARLYKILRIVNPHRNTQNSAVALILTDGISVNSTLLVRPNTMLLRKIIANKVQLGSHIVTDDFWTFNVMRNYKAGKPIADFIPDYYIDKDGSENLNHGFMQYFNLSFSDQFQGVSLKHAWLYLKEYEFRYNRRGRSSQTFFDLTSKFPKLDAVKMDHLREVNFVCSPRRKNLADEG